MDYQTLFNMAVGLAAFFGGWTLNNITKAIERLDKDVREMKEILGKIFDKLEDKVDK